MNKMLVLLISAPLLGVPSAYGLSQPNHHESTFIDCGKICNKAKRLACYDKLHKQIINNTKDQQEAL